MVIKIGRPFDRTKHFPASGIFNTVQSLSCFAKVFRCEPDRVFRRGLVSRLKPFLQALLVY